jgi:peptidoglycan/LPS O-acetylase OafA/YrhL
MRSLNIGYIPRLDHLRLLAALLVFGFHFYHHYLGGWQAQPQAAQWGWIVEGHTGVSLFFVLSGFMFMSIALRGGEIDYRGFMRNRFLRIWPLFLVVFFVAVSVGRDRFQPADVFYLLFTNIGNAPTSGSFITGPAWSISVEFTFYAVFPFLARFAVAQGPGYLLRLIAILLVVKIASYGVTDRSTHMFYSTLVGRFDQFLWGMLAAIAYARAGTRLARWGAWPLLAATALVWGALFLLARHASFFAAAPKQLAWIFWGGAEAVAWATFIVCYLAAPLRMPAPIERALAAGGEWSFSFYMWHTLVIFAVHFAFGFVRLTGHTIADLALNGAAVLAATLAFARLSFTTIERPFLQMRGAYVRHVPDAAGAS